MVAGTFARDNLSNEPKSFSVIDDSYVDGLLTEGVGIDGGTAAGSSSDCPDFSASQAAFPPGISEHNWRPQTLVEEPYCEVPTPFDFRALASVK